MFVKEKLVSHYSGVCFLHNHSIDCYIYKIYIVVVGFATNQSIHDLIVVKSYMFQGINDDGMRRGIVIVSQTTKQIQSQSHRQQEPESRKDDVGDIKEEPNSGS